MTEGCITELSTSVNNVRAVSTTEWQAYFQDITRNVTFKVHTRIPQLEGSAKSAVPPTASRTERGGGQDGGEAERGGGGRARATLDQ